MNFRTLSVLVVAVILMVTTANAQTLQTLINQKQQILANLASRARGAHANRCSDLHNNCGSTGNVGCSVPACGNIFPPEKGFACNTSWGTNTATCGGGCNGLATNTREAVMRFAKGTDFQDPEVAAFSCASKRLDEDFVKHDAQGDLKAWQYMGSATGATRLYPGQPQSRDGEGTCENYDPRIRPWYIAATSGPKDVVLVLDTSGSMLLPNSNLDPNGPTRLAAMQNAVNSLLDSMTHNDFIGIVQFGTTSNYVPNSGTPTLRRGNKANIDLLKSQVTSLATSGKTFMETGFEKAFDLLSSSTNEATSKCTRIVIFLTDGAADNPSLVLPSVTDGQKKLTDAGKTEAHIFTYSMGSNAEDDIPKKVACNNNGVWAKINDGSDPLDEMGQYYQFLAAGIDSTTVRWTTPYEDAFGLGQMVTAAVPVYDYSKSIPLLAGVIGTDVTLAELQKFSDSNSIISELITRSNVCPTITLSKCQMQHLRGNAGQCTTTEDSSWATFSVAECDARNEIVRSSQCNAKTGGLNSVLCEDLNPVKRTQQSHTPITNQQAMCCTTCGGLGGLSHSANSPNGPSSPNGPVGNTTDSGDGDGGSNTGVIIGVVVGVIVGIGLLVGAIVLIKGSMAKSGRNRFENSANKSSSEKPPEAKALPPSQAAAKGPAPAPAPAPQPVPQPVPQPAPQYPPQQYPQPGGYHQPPPQNGQVPPMYVPANAQPLGAPPPQGYGAAA